MTIHRYQNPSPPLYHVSQWSDAPSTPKGGLTTTAIVEAIADNFITSAQIAGQDFSAGGPAIKKPTPRPLYQGNVPQFPGY